MFIRDMQGKKLDTVKNKMVNGRTALLYSLAWSRPLQNSLIKIDNPLPRDGMVQYAEYAVSSISESMEDQRCVTTAQSDALPTPLYTSRLIVYFRYLYCTGADGHFVSPSVIILTEPTYLAVGASTRPMMPAPPL